MKRPVYVMILSFPTTRLQFLCDKFIHIYNQNKALPNSFTVTNVFWRL
jgi:hypothetical protein